MTTDQEFEEFVNRNRDLIERMIELQKGAAEGMADAERDIAREAYGYTRGFADAGRNHIEDMMRSMFATFTDPEVQRHFMNMGMEFMMGMSAIAERAPMPDFAREGYRNTQESMSSAACRARDCGRSQPRPQKVAIVTDEERPARDVADDVFKSCGERRWGSGTRPSPWRGRRWSPRSAGPPLPGSRGTPASGSTRGRSSPSTGIPRGT